MFGATLVRFAKASVTGLKPSKESEAQREAGNGTAHTRRHSQYAYSTQGAIYGTFNMGAVDTYDTTFNSGDTLRVNLANGSRQTVRFGDATAFALVPLTSPFKG